MCNQYRTPEGDFHAGEHLDLLTHDGIVRRGKWAGSATKEKLKWWMSHPGAELVQTPSAVTEVSETAEDDGEQQWCAAPEGAHLLFALLPEEIAKDGNPYRLAKMVTTIATESQEAYFRRDRFPLLGELQADGTIKETPPLPAPAPKPKAQGELF